MSVSSKNQPTIDYLRTLQAVRERSQLVYDLAKQDKLQHFVLDESKLESVADYVLELVARDHGSIFKVPPHGRWRSYKVNVGGGSSSSSPSSPYQERDLVMELVSKWESEGVCKPERVRRVIDLFMVSVLIDAGAGSQWKYADKELNQVFTRTEGLGIAALRMFESGLFSSSSSNPYQADSQGLMKLTDSELLEGFQAADEAKNPLLGGTNRAQLLRSLGQALESSGSSKYFAPSGDAVYKRPGNMMDYLDSASKSPKAVSVEDIWAVILDGLVSVWPASRTQLDGVSLGDVWPCPAVASSGSTDCLIPFHKLSQWLTWSLVDVIVNLAGYTVNGTELLTGLPEYRNGGTFVDMGVLTLKDAGLLSDPPTFEAADPTIVEWRALTVILLDKVTDIIRQKCLIQNEQQCPMLLAKVLEGGTWKAGRELAARLRPETKDPPINIISDGTLF